MPENHSLISDRQPIFDNVHGFIHLTDLEWEIINSPTFQRLRNIKQLGMTNYVFPGATHNRFSHSIGVLHIASQMVHSLKERNQDRDDIQEIDEDLVRLSALLHDIGHYPLSHIVENVVKEHTDTLLIPDIGEIEIDDEQISPSVKKIQKSKSHQLNCKIHGGGDYANHERIASLVICKTDINDILKKYQIDDKKIHNICAIISGKYPGPEKTFIHSELDADRFDYLLRDSYNTGVSYGKFDLNQIIRHLDFQPYKFSNSDPQKEEQTTTGLVIRKKGQRAVEDYLISRYFLYSTVIFQKANIGFHKMMEIVYAGLMEREIVYSYSDILNLFDNKKKVSLFLNYNDICLENTLRKIQQDKIRLGNKSQYKIKSQFLKELINRIINRQPLKLVKSTSYIRETHPKPKDGWIFLYPPKLEEIEAEIKIDKAWIIPSEIITGVTKVNPKLFLMDTRTIQDVLREKIKVYDPDNHDTTSNVTLLTDDDSSIIKSLVNKELVIRNVYTKDEEYRKLLEDYC